MVDRNFTEDLKVLVVAYLPHIEKITSVEALVLSQCALYLEMDEAMHESQKEIKQDDIG